MGGCVVHPCVHLNHELLQMFKRVFPLASVLAVGALAVSLHSVMKKLRSLKGAAFDKAFLENEVGYHEAVIQAVTKTLLPAIRNAELKKLVETVAPAFVAHRDAAKNMLANAR
jgi:predicted outer membrane protein